MQIQMSLIIKIIANQLNNYFNQDHSSNSVSVSSFWNCILDPFATFFIVSTSWLLSRSSTSQPLGSRRSPFTVSATIFRTWRHQLFVSAYSSPRQFKNKVLQQLSKQLPLERPFFNLLPVPWHLTHSLSISFNLTCNRFQQLLNHQHFIEKVPSFFLVRWKGRPRVNSSSASFSQCLLFQQTSDSYRHLHPSITIDEQTSFFSVIQLNILLHDSFDLTFTSFPANHSTQPDFHISFFFFVSIHITCFYI